MATPNDPIQAAFETAVLKFKNDVNDAEIYDKISQATSVDHVYKETKKLQAEQAKHGHLRHLSKIDPYLTRLNDYSDAIGVFVQAKPDILALIWGPIVLLLQWANVLKASFDAVVDTMAEIGNALPEFKQAALLFGRNDRIGDVLLLFFKEIIEFYSIAFRFFRLSRWRYVFEALWPKYRNKIKVVKENVESHTLLLRRDTQSEDIRQQHELRVRALEHFDITDSTDRRQEYRSIMTDVRPERYDDKLHWVQSRVCEGTGRWLLKTPAFTEWLDGSDKSKRCMWLQGIPGSGKTFLSTTAIQSARGRGKALFIFLTYTLADRTSALSVFHSLIFQLASQDEMLQSVVCQSSLEVLRNNLEAAEKLLSNLVLACKEPVYIVVDGLDEIGEAQRCLLVQRLMTLLDVLEGLRVCMSSRPEADLKKCLASQPKSTLRVDAENSGSIQVYVNTWTEDWLRGCHASGEFKSEIRRLLSPLAWKSKGMFLYANVVLKCVEFMDNISEIENELRVLPESLNAAYERIFQRISSLDPYAKTKACKILGWIACAPTPLTLREIQHALTIRTEDREGKLPLQINLQLDKVCGPIVEVVDDCVQFVHFTVKEYISSPRLVECIDIWESTLSLATCCIAYLCQEHHDPGLLEEEISENALGGKYVFHEYATTSWLELVERIISPAAPDAPISHDLIHPLGMLLEDRSNPKYSGEIESEKPAIKALKAVSPDLHELLAKAIQFRQECSASQHKRQQGSSWINLDPLTISHTSVLIHETVDSLLDCQGSPSCYQRNCDGCLLRKIYGARPFNCSFVYCPRRRLGFETRNERQSHEKYHDRPWKCSIPTCEYAHGGFLSRRMRDHHLAQYHQTRETDQIPRATQPDPDPDEIQPLLFDLIQADNIDAVRLLIPFWKPLRKSSVDRKLLELAASFGSPALFVLLLKEGFGKSFGEGVCFHLGLRWKPTGHPGPLVAVAINHGNTEVLDLFLEYLSSFYIAPGSLHDLCLTTLQEVLKSDSGKVYDIWEKYMNIAESQTKRQEQRGPDGLKYTASRFAQLSTLQWTTGFPDRVQFLLNLWVKKRIVEDMGPIYCGGTLVNVARTNFDIDMAKVLLQGGAEVDHRRSDKYTTALHHAARKPTIEAAEFAKFLLLCGASPELQSLKSKTRIRDENGAKNISEHLGVTWDELVARTKKQRDEYLGQGNINPISEEALSHFARLATSHEDMDPDGRERDLAA
ncbi:NACHT domain protein [Lasiosphaeria ovina]|uniref:NACHT domain protein n=1 Tax=Lasiosphaeria ovina TaxID=92902 RepID=A0AAE0NCJ9_9PEZI|nr:NACHT domain protein [Lasiosphaeria ovina]